MTRHYFYADNDQQLGPFTIEELKSKRLMKSCLVWTDGMNDWQTAETIEDLKDFLISEPPPLPKKTNSADIKLEKLKIEKNNSKSSIYDLSYQKEEGITILGIFLFILPIVLKLTGILTFDDIEKYNQAKIFLGIGSLVLRILVTYWVVEISSRQNRDTTAWGFFAFILPTLALIIIGLLKKLKLKIEINNNLPIDEQISMLLDKATKFYIDQRFLESIEITSKVIEFDFQKLEAYKLRGKSYFELKKIEASKLDFEKIVNNSEYAGISNYYLGNIAMTDFDRETAVAFWTKATQNNFLSAQKKLDQFDSFTETYLVKSNDAVKKLGNNSELQHDFLSNSKYEHGILEIDQNENVKKIFTEIRLCENGIKIELRKTLKTFYVAIAFYEINDILYDQKDNILRIILPNNINVFIQCSKSEEQFKDLRKLYENYKRNTGKIPTGNI